MKKIAFLVEPSSQLYNLEKDNIFIVDSALIVYYDHNKEEEINNSAIKHDYFNILKNSKKILTSIPPIGKVSDMIEKLLNEYDIVIGLPLSKFLSNAYNVWKEMETVFNKKFWVLDIDEIEIGIKWVIEFIKDNFDNFDNFNELQELLNDRGQKIINYIVLTNVEKLVVSGRVSKFKSKVIDLLKYKLILSLSKEEKKLTLRKKVSSLKSAIEFIINEIKVHPKYEDNKSIKKIALLSSFDEEEIINEIIKHLNSEFNSLISINRISPIVAAHTGINAFGLYVEVG